MRHFVYSLLGAMWLNQKVTGPFVFCGQMRLKFVFNKCYVCRNPNDAFNIFCQT